MKIYAAHYNNNNNNNHTSSNHRHWYQLVRFRNSIPGIVVVVVVVVLVITVTAAIRSWDTLRGKNHNVLLLSATTTTTSSSSSSSKPFSLLVTLKFTDAQYKDQFLQDFTPLAEYVRRHESSTLSYEALLSDQDPLHVLIMERYQNKDEAYLQIHKSSAPFLEFRPKLQKMQQAGHVSVSGHSYVDAGLGFGDRVQTDMML